MRKKILVLIGALVLLAANNVWAEDKKETNAKYNLGEVLITATKTEVYQAEVGSSTTVITSDDLKKKGKTTVLDVLREIPGVSVMQSGAFGGLTSIYLRGAKSGHTLVLIDGVEVNDPMKADKSFDYGFGHLLTDNIDRIEVVRGPQSTLYGSDAIGGVINIITKKGQAEPKWQALLEGGSYNTFKETLSLCGADNKWDYFFSLLRLNSRGISKAADGTEDDGYENITFSSRTGYEFSENAGLDFVLRCIDAKYDSDDGAYQDDLNDTGWWRNISGKLAFEQLITSVWEHKLSFSYAQTKRKYKDEPDAIDTDDNTHNWFKSGVRKFEWQNNIYPCDWTTLTCGLEYEQERGVSDGRASTDRLDRKTVDNKSCYLQNQFKLRENLFVIPGLRIDENELFGSELTYKISTAYIFQQTNTRFKANWGTGFKAPSLYQLYHSRYGNTELNPDESKSYDLGFEQRFGNDKFSFELTYFHNSFKNMVEYDAPTQKYKNIDNAETKGIELGYSFQPIEVLTVKANYTYTQTEDKNTTKELTKRPQNQIGFNLDWAFLKKGSLNLTAGYIGHRWNNSANTQKIKPYAKVDLSSSYDLTENFQIFGRIENLFDKKFQQVRGYANPGVSFYAGSKITF